MMTSTASAAAGSDYPEHLRWSHRELLFVTLNVPGPTNNSRDFEGGGLLENFTRIEVFGSPEMNWVRVRVSEEAGRVSWEITPGS